MTNNPLILVIDDESQMRRLLQLTLESNGFRIHLTATGADGIRMAASDHPELIILDLGLPDMNGLEALKNIREWSSLPIIILSVRNTEADIVACLSAGADDYLVKPFRTGELLARVKTALRHRNLYSGKEIFQVHGISIDLSARIIKKHSEIVKLTSTEYSLLALFIRNAGRVLTHRYILEQVWGPTFVEETQYTRVYIGQLRKKIEDDPAKPKILITESGIGYRLSIEEY
jgi:two-component system KDP operon response regulator KdpE